MPRKYYIIIFVVLLVVSSSIVLIGALFKLQHWYGSSQLMITGLIGEVIAFGFGAYALLVKNK